MKKLDVEVKVGIFITLGTTLAMLSLIFLGGVDSFFSRYNRYYTHFESVDGLVSGAKIVLGGIQIGTIEEISFDSKQGNVVVKLKVFKRYEAILKKDTMAEILTQGVLGDKFISLTTNSTEPDMLAEGAEIPAKPTRDISQFLSKGDQLLVSLDSIAKSVDAILKSFQKNNRNEIVFENLAVLSKNLGASSDNFKKSIGHLEGILDKVNSGQGTLGALVNDPGLYDDVRALFGGANRNRIVRNLVRQTVQSNEEADAANARRGKKER
ncbi:MlaD family protein [bacterium]|jgi:phospholipid/cholesterol/gamma-HCH transport system substrate-binding protein|nr:MlaD family protein [bacterium]